MSAFPPPDLAGTLRRHADFPSAHVAPRHVDVWLPPGYDDAARRFPVLYMHDGQNVFDPATCYTGIDWGVDEAFARLAAEGRAAPAIVVAVWNTPARVLEYMPRKPLLLPQAAHFRRRYPDLTLDDVLSDRYLAFLVTEVKPFIDATYRTRPEQEATYIMGSSMGGLISLYAVCEYPGVFRGAGCLSTHWPIGDGIVLDYFREALPPPGRHLFYFDYGTGSGDELYAPFQDRADAVLRAAGYRHGHDWMTARFEGARHHEEAWRSRLDVPLRFLLCQ